MLKYRARAVFLVIIAVVIGYFVYETSLPGGSRQFHLGLDLSGGTHLGIFLDGNLISNPVIQDEIPDGKGQITGNFTVEEAQTLVRNLNFGALPVPISLISTQTIGPSLGQSAVNGGIRAGIV